MTIGKGWIIGFVLLFALSLAGNLFAGGLMLGRHFFQPTSPTVEGAAQRFFETVPEAARPVIRRHLRDQAIEIALELRQIRQARQHVAEVVGRPTLDDKALADAFAQFRVAHDRAAGADPQDDGAGDRRATAGRTRAMAEPLARRRAAADALRAAAAVTPR